MNEDKEKMNSDIDDTFGEDFEVIYEGDLPELPNDLGNDGYKDVLSSLSDLDPTNSMTIDYLAENKTRTIDLSSLTQKLAQKKKQEDEDSPKKELGLLLWSIALLISLCAALFLFFNKII